MYSYDGKTWTKLEDPPLKKGTYKVKVKVKAAGTAIYNAGTKKVTLKIKVR